MNFLKAFCSQRPIENRHAHAHPHIHTHRDGRESSSQSWISKWTLNKKLWPVTIRHCFPRVNEQRVETKGPLLNTKDQYFPPGLANDSLMWFNLYYYCKQLITPFCFDHPTAAWTWFCTRVGWAKHWFGSNRPEWRSSDSAASRKNILVSLAFRWGFPLHVVMWPWCLFKTTTLFFFFFCRFFPPSPLGKQPCGHYSCSQHPHKKTNNAAPIQTYKDEEQGRCRGC